MKLKLLWAAIIMCCGIWATPASAQATRTWVSGVGDDVNPCSRTAPCKTFAGAISKTAAGGEINCIDPGGFGTLAITKSITIDCGGVLGSALASMTTGFVINAPGGKVVLRNLAINGATNGIYGIRVMNAASVHVSDTNIQGFDTANGAGIYIDAGTARVFVRDVNILHNQIGLKIQPAASATVTVVDSSVNSNIGNGISIDGAGNRLFLSGTTISHNATGINAKSSVVIDNSSIMANIGTAIIAEGANGKVSVSDSLIAGNAVGFATVGGASIASYGDNRVSGNGAPENFPSPAVTKR